MTISSQFQSQSVARRSISTLLNLSTSKRSFMILWNPDCIQRADWFVHISVMGVSLVYFSLATPEGSYEDETARLMGVADTIKGMTFAEYAKSL